MESGGNNFTIQPFNDLTIGKWKIENRRSVMSDKGA
jgi:hypothetical protein